MAYYVHIPDPGFPDPPWPGYRRLGPFLTADEATAQAVEDIATGHATLLEVLDEENSEKLRADPSKRARRVRTAAQLLAAGTKLRESRHADRVRSKREDAELLASVTPGVDPADLEEIL